MSHPSENLAKKLDRDQCRQYLKDQVFRLRPADYCEKYPNWPGMVGIELEMGVIQRNTMMLRKPKVAQLAGPVSLTSVLLELAKAQGWNAVMAEGKDYLKCVMLNDNDQLTFEPGGQLEFSSRTYPCLSQVIARMNEVQGLLDDALAKSGMVLIQYGINPWLTVKEVGLQMNKPRYQAMDKYFGLIGEFGQRMMRQTCTVQVCLDFGPDERTMAKRYLASNLLAPIATAIFANSPVVDGRLTEFRSFRSQTWRKLDFSRTGVPKLERIVAELSVDSCIDAYLEAILAARVVFVEALDFRAMDGSVTFEDWLNQPIDGVSPTQQDLETHLSLFFPEVRARGFLEMRSVDCQARAFQSVPAAFYSALLYEDRNLDQVLELLVPYHRSIDRLLRASAYGLQQDATLADLAQRVMYLAVEGYRRLPSCFHDAATDKAIIYFHEHFTARRRTPADDIADARIDARYPPTPEGLMNIYNEWVLP